MDIDGIQEQLLRALDDSCENESFDVSRFYPRWFDKEHSYFFLFKKNLKVTNIAHAELLALLRTFITSATEPVMASELQFTSSREFKDTLSALIQSFPLSTATRSRDLERISSLYAGLLARLIVVDSFYTSCVVSLPAHLAVDLASICGKSGYIHSCGHLIYVRNISKASKEMLFSELRRYFKSSGLPAGQKNFFAVYAHEDFTKFDRGKEAELRNGLDGVKVFVEKCYMGNVRLVSVLAEMRTQFRKQLEIPAAGDYRRTHKPALRSQHVLKDRTLWLIADSSVNADDVRHPGHEIFLICYEQRFLNQNQFHIFDENKPAWVAHTTLPHKLAGAMISITRPNWPIGRPTVIADPFCGSGTLALEASKFEGTRVVGSDTDPLASLLFRDNVAFLRPSPSFIARHIATLRGFERDSEDGKQQNVRQVIDALNAARRSTDLAVEYDRADLAEDRAACTRIARELGRSSLSARLTFYIGLRAIRRHAAALQREAEVWYTAYQAEAHDLRLQFERLGRLVGLPVSRRGGGQLVIQGMYSESCTIDHASALERGPDRPIEMRVQPADHILRRRWDVIVTDPPYGINTQEDCFMLAELYANVASALMAALADHGQLVMCLPEHTRTGQAVPFFAQKEIVVQQILTAAQLQGREIVTLSSVVPGMTALYRAPYYWESERALRRVVLHFQVGKKRTANSSRLKPPAMA